MTDLERFEEFIKPFPKDIGEKKIDSDGNLWLRFQDAYFIFKPDNSFDGLLAVWDELFDEDNQKRYNQMT